MDERPTDAWYRTVIEPHTRLLAEQASAELGVDVEYVSERLIGAVPASDSFAAVLEQARRALVEARFLLVSEGGSTFEQREQAVAVLEVGIRQAEFALHLWEGE